MYFPILNFIDFFFCFGHPISSLFQIDFNLIAVGFSLTILVLG